MSLVFPIFGLLLSLSYIKGARLQIRKYMNDSDNFPTLAALFWVGQTFTLFVIALDSLAIRESTTHMTMEQLESYQLAILIVNLCIELLFWLLAIAVISILSITHCLTGEKYATQKKILSKNCLTLSAVPSSAPEK